MQHPDLAIQKNVFSNWEKYISKLGHFFFYLARYIVQFGKMRFDIKTNTTQVITHRKDPQEDALVGRGFSPKCSGNRLFPGWVEFSWQDILDRIGELILRSSYNQHNDDAITNYRPQLERPSGVITWFGRAILAASSSYNNPAPPR